MMNVYINYYSVPISMVLANNQLTVILLSLNLLLKA
jgi:hypothetical protein